MLHFFKVYVAIVSFWSLHGSKMFMAGGAGSRLLAMQDPVKSQESFLQMEPPVVCEADENPKESQVAIHGHLFYLVVVSHLCSMVMLLFPVLFSMVNQLREYYIECICWLQTSFQSTRCCNFFHGWKVMVVIIY